MKSSSNSVSTRDPAALRTLVRIARYGRALATRPLCAAAILAGAMILAPVAASHAPALAKAPFTITDDAVLATVVDTMQLRTCTGTLVPIWWAGLPHWPVKAIFSRRPDGSKWVRFVRIGLSENDLPVIELGASAQWTDHRFKVAQKEYITHYTVWPAGDNRLKGTTTEPWGDVDLTCD